MNRMKKWYLVKTKTSNENVAIKNLENQGYTVYCPFCEINKNKYTLFPGYLFIYLDNQTENWSPIRSTKGVINLVKFGNNFAQVSDSVIAFIRSNEYLTREKITNLDRFECGDNVQITNGIFKNCIAIFKSFKSDERVILLLKIMGQQHSLNIKKDSVIRL
jgi:transcriptional antiterminator RfaH